MSSRTTQAELDELEALARDQGVRVIYSRKVQKGGHCLLRGKPIVLLGSHFSTEEKIELLRSFFSSPRHQTR